jgi:hypothetical protein
MFSYPENIETNEQKKDYLEGLVLSNQYSTENLAPYIKALDDLINPK